MAGDEEEDGEAGVEEGADAEAVAEASEPEECSRLNGSRQSSTAAFRWPLAVAIGADADADADTDDGADDDAGIAKSHALRRRTDS